MMRKIVLILLLLNFINLNFCVAQLRGINWCLSDSAGISFLSGTPSNTFSKLCTLPPGYPLTITENTSCISDENGSLLFYSNGVSVWDRNNDTLPLGSYLIGGSSVTNGSLFLPFPTKEDSIICLFNLWTAPFYYPKGLYYSIINTHLRNGFGDGIPGYVNLPGVLTDSTSEQLTAVRHANGRDWWILFKTGKENDYFKILFGPNGIEKIDSQNVGVKLNMWNWGEISNSKPGEKIGAVYRGNSFGDGKVEILSFDRCSGTLQLLYSEELPINTDEFYGCSFSPNGRNFYYSTHDSLYQISISANNTQFAKTTIAAHQFMNPPDSMYSFWQHELAPDGKIYIICSKNNSPSVPINYRDKNLCVINTPDSIGTACDFQFWSYYLGGKRVTLGLPNMPNYNLGPLTGSECDTISNSVSEFLNYDYRIHLYPNPAQSSITIESADGKTINQVTVTDVLARIIYEQQTNSQLSIINCQLFPAGVYFIKVQLQDGSVTVRKFIKE